MSDVSLAPDGSPAREPGLRSLIAAHESPTNIESAIQIVTAIGLFVAGCAAMYWSLGISYLLTLALALPTAGFAVRIFIVQHDCGHGAFLKSARANHLVGMLCSVITLTPYANWRRQHNQHHGNWNNLDRRESGADIYSACLTVAEYQALSPWKRFTYRLVRHPVIAHFVLPPLVFLFLFRIPFDTPKSWARERRSTYWTDLALLAALGALWHFIGIRQVLLVQLPIVALMSIIGVALFSLQHRFDGVLWARQGSWTMIDAALKGSSYFRLPRVLQWFTGNIGFHHIHHLSPRVPNYRLQACHNAIPALRQVTTLDWRDGLKAMGLMLWDEADGRMVGFKDAGTAILPDPVAAAT
jgi:omega-6 fatty acid desaturase (delta-12 desaturase)